MFDYFTKWVEAYPIKEQEAKTVAEVFVKEFVSRKGIPMIIHSDQGRNFEYLLFHQMCQLFGIKKTRTTAFKPSENGLEEDSYADIGIQGHTTRVDKV